MPSLAIDIALLVLLIALAGWTVIARDGFAAIAAFIAYGVILVLAWFRLRSPDVALTEGAIATGLTGIVLFHAYGRLRNAKHASDPDRMHPLAHAAVLLLCIGVVIALSMVVLDTVEPAPTLAHQAAANLPALGLGNPVTGVLLGFRGMDTLLEKVVLFLAVMAVWSLGTNRSWPRAPEVSAEPRHPAITMLARVLIPFGVVFAFYLLWNGADRPGGAFASASVLAAMWLLALMAGLARMPAVSSRALRATVVAGPMAFIAVAFVGAVTANAFLAYPESWAKPLILFVEIPLTLSVAVMLTLLVAGPPVEQSRS